MNNRYLYRAKTRSRLWVQGFLSHRDNKYYISNKAGMPFAYEVVKDTICQCTGIKDKNGKLIWENDICCYNETHSDICVIKFGEYDNNKKYNHIGFYTEWKTYDFMFRQDLGFWARERELEVIGNIFDNPELIEQEE